MNQQHTSIISPSKWLRQWTDLFVKTLILSLFFFILTGSLFSIIITCVRFKILSEMNEERINDLVSKIAESFFADKSHMFFWLKKKQFLISEN